MTAPAFGPGKPQKDILEAWKEICVESGSICKVGPEYYRGLANLSDKPLTNLLELIIRDRADEINAWVFAEPRMKSDEDLYDYLEIQVELFGRGYLCVIPMEVWVAALPRGRSRQRTKVVKLIYSLGALAGLSDRPSSMY